MKDQIKYILLSIACIVFSFACSSCSNDEPEVASSDDKVVNTIMDKASIAWNSSMEQVQKHMKGFSLVASDEDFLQYSDKKGDITVSYEFANDSLRATVAIVPKLTDNDLSPYLKDYTDFAELSSKKVYYNSRKNTICLSYETKYQDIEYSIIGFTPIISNLYATFEPIIVTTNEVIDISKYSGRIKGTVSGVSKSCTCGVRYSTSTDLSGAKTKTINSNGDFQITISGLSRETTYYCQCYVIFDGYTYYGEIISFTTLS